MQMDEQSKVHNYYRKDGKRVIVLERTMPKGNTIITKIEETAPESERWAVVVKHRIPITNPKERELYTEIANLMDKKTKNETLGKLYKLHDTCKEIVNMPNTYDERGF